MTANAMVRTNDERARCKYLAIVIQLGYALSIFGSPLIACSHPRCLFFGRTGAEPTLPFPAHTEA
jgi:hypothetical protein